jgi:hypothetical protein
MNHLLNPILAQPALVIGDGDLLLASGLVLRRDIQDTFTFSLNCSSTQMTLKETRNLQKTAQASKVVNAFTRALAPPFIGRRRDFYIPKIPLRPKEYS